MQVLSLKATNLSNRGWSAVTPSDSMEATILAESEHLGIAARCSLSARWIVWSPPEGVAALHPRLLKLSPSVMLLLIIKN